MDFNEYQELSKRTMPKMDGTTETWKSAVSNYSMGLAGEMGEWVDVMKKEIHHGHPQNIEALMGECGDLLHYAAGLATLFGFTLEEAAEANIHKLKKRYPLGFNEEDSIKRVDVHG